MLAYSGNYYTTKIGGRIARLGVFFTYNSTPDWFSDISLIVLDRYLSGDFRLSL